MIKLPVYLDNNATTRVDDRVLAEMLPYFTTFYGNAASRSNSYGWEAEEAVDYARSQVAKLINADPKEIIFTSGATEAVNLALKGVAEMYATKGKHIITLQTEHKAVLDSCLYLEKIGYRVSVLKVDSDGRIDPSLLEASIQPDTILISVMYANNETGVIQPVREISALAKKNGVLFFTDATQAAGKIPLDVIADGIDLMAFSAHKMYGPKGTGALYIRRKDPRVRVTAQINGGGHERAMRSGTLNVPGIVGFGKACELCRLDMAEDSNRITRLRNALEAGLTEHFGVVVNGNPQYRLPNVCNVSFVRMGSQEILQRIVKNIAVSSGSACTSAVPEASYVLRAMYGDDDLAKSAIRFSLGRFTTQEEIEYTLQFLRQSGEERKQNIIDMKADLNLP